MLKAAHEIAKKFGLYVMPNNYKNNQWIRLSTFLNRFDVDALLDVGANVGQFASSILRSGYQGQVVSIEALPEAHKALMQAAHKHNMKVGREQWVVAPRVAISDIIGETSFYVSQNSFSSSMLELNDFAQNDVNQKKFGTKEVIVVPTTTIDDLLKEISVSSRRWYLKVDVQGAEKKVLLGAKNSMASILGLQLELCVKPTYRDQADSDDLHAEILKSGFEVWDIIPGFRDPETARLCEYDGVYIRKSNE